MASALSRLRKYYPGWGYGVLCLVVILLSALASIDFTPEKRFVTAGEIAPRDIVADRTLLFEDREATKSRREQTRRFQPLVCDLVLAPSTELRSRIQSILIRVNQAETAEEREELRVTFGFELGVDLPASTVLVLSENRTQNFITQSLLPFVESRLREGVLSDMRTAMSYPGGIMVRNLDSGEEVLHPEAQAVADIKSLEAEIVQKLKDMKGTAPGRRVVSQIFLAMLRPTLLPNLEATKTRADDVIRAVPAVMSKITRGEILLHQGDRVTAEIQVKLQAMWPKTQGRFNFTQFLGLVIVSIILTQGILFSPSGKATASLRQKDYVFIASLVAVFSLLAKGLFVLGKQLALQSTTFPAESLAFAVPVAGAAALASLIFTTRRYVVLGLLLAFFCTVMSQGGMGLFLFYFFSSMWNTWLTARTQSRQDMVWSIWPLLLGLFAMWAGATMVQDGAYHRYLPEFLSTLGGGILSMLLTFALAPVVEMVFGYTTRFKLMEFMNLEQPLLRDLMLNAPGTYHHSLIVSNMVEAAAKAVGAHSLLCKVAALYHDIGKISKAGYFIENQFASENPHDKLSPSMSALVLISHTKQGEELGTQHNLGREVTDIVRQHHGTGVIRYFYQKALNQTDVVPPKIEDFSYPGPKPQTREAAIVMLADAVEASSRVLGDPTPNRLRTHIDGVMKSIFADGQLDESELTFRDLDKIGDSFLRILTGIFHHRIEYPDRRKMPPSKPAPKPQSATAALSVDNAQGAAISRPGVASANINGGIAQGLRAQGATGGFKT